MSEKFVKFTYLADFRRKGITRAFAKDTDGRSSTFAEKKNVSSPSNQIETFVLDKTFSVKMVVEYIAARFQLKRIKYSEMKAKIDV